ncbi:MAG: phenylalanine--tRNA ligase subunit beta [Candidatus Micrarchaeota archaeon]|nr:phenylalanine--tRNA ligase subunit beta [Candidatus Micrarchaeota archaeon]
MATVTFAAKDLKAEGIDYAKLEDIVSAIGMSVESRDAENIMIDVTNNRPDMLSFRGFVRAVKYFTGALEAREGRYKLTDVPRLDITVDASLQKARPYMAAMVVENANLAGNMLKYLINFTDKLSDTYGRRRKKFAIGIHDLSKVKGAITYTMQKEGRMVPLGGRAEADLSSVAIGSRKGQEYAGMVGEKGPFPVIKDSEKVLALVPIINCNQTAVQEQTKSLFIELTGTSRPSMEAAARLVACSLMDAGAKVYPCRIKYANGESSVTPELPDTEMKLKVIGAERTIGVPLTQNGLIGMLNKMGYYAARFGKDVVAYVPPYRIDLLNDQDLVEDVAIAFGYDRINPLPVVGFSIGIPQDYIERERRLSMFMVGLGFSQALNTLLTGQETNYAKMGARARADHVRIEYSKSESATMLRTRILPGLLANLGAATHERMPQKLFEVGSVFSIDGGQVVEQTRMAFVSEHSKANFAEAKAHAETVLRQMGVKDFRIEGYKDPAFIEGRAAAAYSGDNLLCYFGEIHPNVLVNFGMEEPVVAGEFVINPNVKYE